MSDLKIFTDNIEPEALSQIYTLVKQPAFQNCKVRIMPDVHAGTGCVIGFTADLGDKVVPNLIGVDIGCGMETVNLGKIEIDFKVIDEIIKKYVPSGRKSHDHVVTSFPKLKELFCFKNLKEAQWLEYSLGTLGRGNHFIEIDADEEGNKYLIIHSGSRNLGKQVADHYQNLAIGLMQGEDELAVMQEKLIAEYKAAGKQKEIQSAIKEMHKTFKPKKLNIPKELCYLEGNYRDMYLHDMKICQEYADLNRKTMAKIIIEKANLSPLESFSTIHNYVEFSTNMIRKGAISAKEGELLLIPLNMRDGCIIGRGKGNNDWNCSAPHGAGRLFNRSTAKKMISLEEYKEAMTDVYTTCVTQSTIDESPMAYKPSQEIVNLIQDTVDIIKIIKPIYNYKACE